METYEIIAIIALFIGIGLSIGKYQHTLTKN
jgi:hypothetical protein